MSNRYLKIFVVVVGDNCKTPAETFCPGDRKGLMRSIGDEPYTPTFPHQEGSYMLLANQILHIFLIDGFLVP